MTPEHWERTLLSIIGGLFSVLLIVLMYWQTQQDEATDRIIDRQNSYIGTALTAIERHETELVNIRKEIRQQHDEIVRLRNRKWGATGTLVTPAVDR